MSTLDLDIGVIYTHERELMPRLLTTMSASGRGLRSRLILVDNASKDGVDRWTGFFDETLVLRNDQRLTYSANLNRILGASSARYVLLMNTDMYFDPGEQCLGRMVALMDSEPRCGLAGCRILRADGGNAHGARRFPTLPLVMARRCGLGGLLRRSLENHFYAEHGPDETWACDWLSGCFLMVRREAFKEVGPLDEGYGKYFEDVDYCLRMSRAGWQVMHHGATSCFHLERRASKNLFKADAWIHILSYVRWLGKWGFRPDPLRKGSTPGDGAWKQEVSAVSCKNPSKAEAPAAAVRHPRAA
jgi:N-acetylglucosaminyl-diphospho-decaprenol L-rhamnosyltransferase